MREDSMITNNGIKKTVGLVAVILFIIVFAVWFIMKPAPEHIEDTNGPDDYSLQTITHQDVIELKMGSRGGPSTRESKWNIAGFDISEGIQYCADKFTGVYLLHTSTVFKGSDIYVYISDFEVNSGNFAFYVVFDDEIVGEIKPNEPGLTEFLLENIDKTASLEYIIAGESASFSFTAPTGW